MISPFFRLPYFLWIPYYRFCIATALTHQQALDRIQGLTISPMAPFLESSTAFQAKLAQKTLFTGEVPSHRFAIRELDSTIFVRGKILKSTCANHSRFQLVFSTEPYLLVTFTLLGSFGLWALSLPFNETFCALIFFCLIAFMFFSYHLLTKTLKTKEFLTKLLEAK